MKTNTSLTLAQIIEAGHDAEQAPAVLALCLHLDCTPHGVSLERHDHYGLPVYSTPSGAYAVGTDTEAQEAAEKAIADSVWAFNASFIISQCGLPSELEEGIRTAQEKQCESANEWLTALIEKCCAGGMTGSHSFSESAISADGRGHFLSSYDGEENEETVDLGDDGLITFYIYRTN